MRRPKREVFTLRLLVVCTGNICRSPLAERLLARALPEAEVSSAGTGAPVGRAMDPQSAAELIRLGGDPSGHRARRLTPALAEEADLILVATREHRQAVVGLSPRVLHRTFTLLEAAALAPGGVEGETLKEQLRSLSRRRSAVSGEPLDLADPIGRSDAVHRAVADQIGVAVVPIADLLRPLN